MPEAAANLSIVVVYKVESRLHFKLLQLEHPLVEVPGLNVENRRRLEVRLKVRQQSNRVVV